MAFIVLEAGQFNAGGLKRGECSLGRNGSMMVRADDLLQAGISNRVLLMIDPETRRIGLRAPRDNERHLSLSVSMVPGNKGDDSGRRRISVGRAIKRLGLTTESVAGRYTLAKSGDEKDVQLLYVSLDEAKTVPSSRAYVPGKLVTNKGK